MQVLLDSTSPKPKRIAAYLVLMKDPQPTELAQLVDVLPKEQDQQVRSFVDSHMINILATTEPETEEYVKSSRRYVFVFFFSIIVAIHQMFFELCLTVPYFFLFPRLRQKIGNALQDNRIGSNMDPTKFSRNYKIGSVEGNMIFEDNSYLPKEAMLEMTLKAFGYDIDMMEVNILGCFILICWGLIYFFRKLSCDSENFVTIKDWYGGQRI